MKNIEEQLKELPEEFIIEMEQQKKDRWVDVFNFLVNYFDIQNEIAFTLRTEVDLIEEAKSQSFSNHTITQALYSAKNNNVKNYYETYLIDFPEDEVFAWVLITTTPSYFNKNREYLNDIVCSLTTIELNSHE